jgi:hypothetical protein
MISGSSIYVLCAGRRDVVSRQPRHCSPISIARCTLHHIATGFATLIHLLERPLMIFPGIHVSHDHYRA